MMKTIALILTVIVLVSGCATTEPEYDIADPPPHPDHVRVQGTYTI